MKETYIVKKFKPESLAIIEKVNEITADYQAQGYKLSLRQLYYQLVAANVIPNKQQNYKNLSALVSDARLAGLVDWDAMEDRNREMVWGLHFENPAERVRVAMNNYRLDMWSNQPSYVELFVEKQALEGVLIPVCQRLDVPFTANKGYTSSSAAYEIGKRLVEHVHQDITVLYLGDHDPSGVQMTFDIARRFALMSGLDTSVLNVERLALNMDQIDNWQLPPNPAKQTDSRYLRYSLDHGSNSWELDAVSPARLSELVEKAITGHIDGRLWSEMLQRQRQDVRRLQEIVDELEGEYG